MEWPYNISAQDILARAMTPLSAPAGGYHAMPQMTPAHFGQSHVGLSTALLQALQTQAGVPGLLAAQHPVYRSLGQAGFSGLYPGFNRYTPPAAAVDPAAVGLGAPGGLLAGAVGRGNYAGQISDGGSANGAADGVGEGGTAGNAGSGTAASAAGTAAAAAAAASGNDGSNGVW